MTGAPKTYHPNTKPSGGIFKKVVFQKFVILVTPVKNKSGLSTQAGPGRLDSDTTRLTPTSYKSGQFITTSAEVTPNGGLVRESPPKWP